MGFAMPKYSQAVHQLQLHERYYLELGRFIQRFAGIEAKLQDVLWHFSGVSPEVARSIFSGVRPDQAVSFIKRLNRSRGTELHPMLAETLDQVSVINAARNMIIHYGALFDNGMPTVVTNRRIANHPDETLRFPVTSSSLDALTADIQHIHLRLNLFLQRNQTKPTRFERAVAQLQQRAWRYKHVVEVGAHP
jgi:hypothetical protein